MSELQPESSQVFIAQTQQCACFSCCLQLRTDGLPPDREENMNSNQQEDEKDAAAGIQRHRNRSFQHYSSYLNESLGADPNK